MRLFNLFMGVKINHHFALIDRTVRTIRDARQLPGKEETPAHSTHQLIIPGIPSY